MAITSLAVTVGLVELLGRYHLERRLATGGMGEVWEATARGDSGFTRRVAIKRLFADQQGDPSFLRMFLDEARIASRLHHANIVGIVDYGVIDGVPFQVLEYVDGFDLSRLARWGTEQARPLPLGLALFIASEIAHALHHAHSAVDDAGQRLNIVHRDVSPQNILVSRGGDVKLSDFGIAVAEGRTERTVGGAKGKPAYMAPEQAIRGAVDARTDVFALGCVLHALVTGASPLVDDNALIDLLAGVELSLSPELSPTVHEVVARATRRDRAQRFESAEAFALGCNEARRGAIAEEPRTALKDWVRLVAPPPERRTTPASHRDRGAAPGRAAKARTKWLLLPATLLAGLGGAWWWVARSGEASLRPEAVSFGALQAPLPVPVERSPAPEPAAGPRVVAEVDEVGTRALSPAAERKRTASPERPARARPGARVATATGVLAVGGEGYLRAEVIIDGEARGFAPRRFELPVGAHDVQLVLPSGERVGPKKLDITARHTTTAPATLVADAPGP